jgi:hypothetical protein
MSAMDHGTAHERIEDLLLEPARLAGLDASHAEEDLALREHLAGCPACQADLDSWARLQAVVRDALPGSMPELKAAVEAIDLPPSLRARVLASVRAASTEAPLAPLSMAKGPRRWAAFQAPRTAWLGLAAALVVLVVGAGVLVNQAARLNGAREEARGLAAVMAAVDRVLSEPQHRVVALTTPQGAAGGSISWTRHDLVVLSTSLPAPKPGEVYRCWLFSDGEGWAVGKMYFAGDTAYWVGSLDEWASFEIGPSTQFRVSLEPPGADPSTRSGPVVLEAALGA